MQTRTRSLIRKLHKSIPVDFSMGIFCCSFPDSGRRDGRKILYIFMIYHFTLLN